MDLRLAVVIPTLDEADEIGACLASLRSAGGGALDVVVADGGSRDATIEAVPETVRVVRTRRGRARQMNAGARAAAGDALLFLHADCRLPPGAAHAALDALGRPGVVGGVFHVRWRSDRFLLRAGGRLRTKVWFATGFAFGDQALFVRRDAFEALGGFDEAADCEDLDLVRRLRRRGRLVLLASSVSVSGRRLEREGIARTWASWWRRGLRQAWWTARNPGAPGSGSRADAG